MPASVSTPCMRKTRIVCVSDTHNQTPKLPRGDVLIHAGDLTNQGSYSELKKAVEWIEKQDFEAKIVVAGNLQFLSGLKWLVGLMSFFFLLFLPEQAITKSHSIRRFSTRTRARGNGPATKTPRRAKNCWSIQSRLRTLSIPLLRSSLPHQTDRGHGSRYSVVRIRPNKRIGPSSTEQRKQKTYGIGFQMG